MSDLVTDLRRLYEQLEKDREVLTTNLLKIRELIEINEKNREDTPKQPSQPIRSNPQPAPAAPAIPPPLTSARENLEKARGMSKTIPQQPYNPNTTWQKKIIYTLSLLTRPATAKEIAQKIKDLEPDSLQSIDKSVELTTSRMSKAGEITAQKEGVKNYYSLKSIM